MIWETYTQVTGDQRRFNDNCSSCILSLLTDCGKLYFQSIEELNRRESPSKEVKASQEGGKPIRKARIKTKEDAV